ncbi:MAG: hypothetical protein QF535_11685, partial [Anaerolineales bacterium]|nr:hypothetical protein [Anaerolineales bacterium]
MKKRSYYIIILLILTFLGFALVSAATTVTLNSPASGNTSSSSTMVFNCSVSDDTYAISSVALYTDTSGSWAQTGSAISGNVSSAQFSVSSIADGAYSWNCLVTNANSDMTSASTNSSLTISASGFTGTISNQTIIEDTNTSNAFDLDTYFTGATTYTVTGNTSNIVVRWDSENQVSFMPDINYTGSELMTFSADTGSSSNVVNVSVPNINDPPYVTGNISNYTIEINTALSLDLSDIFAEVD